MRNLKIKLSGVDYKFYPYICIDGQIVKTNLDKNSPYNIDYSTEKDKVEIVVFRYLELENRFWWIWAFLSYLISFFGIFEPMYDKNYTTIDCRFDITLNENNYIHLKFNPMKDGTKAIDIITQCNKEEKTNVYILSKKAKIRKRVYVCLKVISWFVITGLIIAFIINK